MDSSNLMLSNWVQDGDGYGQVTSIDGDSISTTSNNLLLPIECYDPILLSPEIMAQINTFEKVKYEPKIRGEYRSGKYHVSLLKGKIIIVNQMGMIHEIGDCKYLHELQNWFTMFGKPLEITFA